MKCAEVVGTNAGYTRHRRAGETPCDLCKEAHTMYCRGPARKYAAKNKEARLASARERYKKIAESEKDRQREYRKNNPNYYRDLQRKARSTEQGRQRLNENQRRRRAREINATPVPFSPEQLSSRMNYFGNKCWMCGCAFEHVDHVKPLSKGGLHILANLRPSCQTCNQKKLNKWPVDTSMNQGGPRG